MSGQSLKRLAVLLGCIAVLAGCHPTQPFYLESDGDLSHYLERATELEAPDVCEPRLDEVTHAMPPLTLSDPEPREMWDLTLEEAVSIALQNSKVIRNLGGVTQFQYADALIGRTASSSTVYDPALVESDPQNGVEAALAAFDAQLRILGSNNGTILNHFDRPATSFGTATPVLQDTGGLRTEIAKRSATGLQMFARNQTDYQRGLNQIGTNQPIRSFWETLFELEVRQPLLRGRGTQVNRIPVLLARINTDVTLASFEANVRNLVLDVENTYWDLYLTYRLLESARIGRDWAQNWAQQLETKRTKQSPAYEEAQAREQYFFFRASLEQALRQVYDTENRLRFLMGLTASDGRLIRPADEPTIAKVAFDWHAIHNEALFRSPELRQQKWSIQRAELQLIAARNQLLPQLDVGAAYRWFGIGDNLISADRNGIDFAENRPELNAPTDGRGPAGSNAFDVLTNGNYQEAGFFLSFEMPVGYRRELAGVRNAQISLVREKARLEDMELNLSHLLGTTVRGLDTHYLVAQTHFNRVRASTEETDSLRATYEGGKPEVSLDQVLEAQRRHAMARDDYFRSIVDYNKALAEIHFRKGSLLEHNNICLAEGAWPEKAYWDAMERARERDASYYLNYGWTRPRVISQGPISQQSRDALGVIGNPPEVIFEEPVEDVPSRPATPQTAPREAPSPAPKEVPEPSRETPPPKEPQKLGPITDRPEGPSLNAPRLRAEATRPSAPVAAKAGAFEWGDMGLGTRPLRAAEGLRPASFP